MAKYLLLLFFIVCSGVEGSNDNSYRRNKGATRMFVFGDSYADTGNIAKPLANSWKEPYGHSFPGHPSGRFSDGRILTDFIAKFLGFTAPIPSSRMKSEPHKARHGVNFACGGTGALETVATTKLGLPNLSSQIDSFETLLHGNNAKADLLTNSIAFVSCAGNDYDTYFHKGGQIEQVPNYIQQVVNQVAKDVQRIKRLGIQKIILTGLQPLGCLPQTTVGYGYKQCDYNDNIAVMIHNRLLKEAVDKLAKAQNYTSGSIVILDLFDTFAKIFEEKHGGKLRFKDPFKPCCIPTNKNGSCSDVGKDGKKMYSLCKKPAATFFWDSYHPTQAGWRAVFSHLKPTLHKLI